MDLGKIKEKAIKEIGEVKSLEELDNVRVFYLGRKGELNKVLRSLKDLSLEEKKETGPKANALKNELSQLISEKQSSLEKEKSSDFDVTKPGSRMETGHLHPLTRVEREIFDIFRSLNFSVINGPEVENEYYNFDALNIPPGHPARDMWDTFWISKNSDSKKSFLLRTHTSPVQVRYMESHHPPFQIIVPGRTFRYEATDASHEINFYQLEGLMVGKDVTFANLKYIVEEFLSRFFSKEIEFRFRPSYFPFTEPSIEVDARLPENHKKGGEWLELMGAGMVNRNVFSSAHYNSDEVQGFAFGIGIDRLAMIKYNIPDIRLFYSGDLRFIRQF
jgi:phenylalanyl-tRNA synthetase alpha chain